MACCSGIHRFRDEGTVFIIHVSIYTKTADKIWEILRKSIKKKKISLESHKYETK